ncbi:lantibiotic dehydratase [Paenibacillus azoreducens]|uniref:lantibiotic dehydratase n=1 Tax=Paenibacillus azoreducens TaxID=116718 RepID=UPI0039F4DF34
MQKNIEPQVTENKTSTLYKPLPFFMMRSPLLPLEFFDELVSSGDFHSYLEKVLDNEKILESILVSSTRLYEALPYLTQSNKKKRNQVSSSVLKYLSRMSTRPTPFGLYAAVASGKLTNRTKINMASKLLFKRSRPDMEWLLGIVGELEKRIDVVKQLRVVKNSVVQNTGGRIVLLYPSSGGQFSNENTEKASKVTIKATPPVNLALSLAETPISFEELLQQLIKEFGGMENAGEEVITNFLWELFSKEFLISELRPPLTLSSPLEYILHCLDRLEGVEKERECLRNVKTLMQTYDSCDLGEGIDTFLELTSYMSRFCDTKSVVQVDLGLAAETIHLNSSVGDEIAKAAEILWMMSSSKRGFSHLKEYHSKFLDAYGIACDVPILELLNEETGLGVPSAYLNPNVVEPDKQEMTDKEIGRELKLMELVEQSLLNRDEEIEITDSFIDAYVESDRNTDEASHSIEIYAEVIASSPQAVDRGEFTLAIAPNPGSFDAGATFGRFLDMFSDETKEWIGNIRKRREEIQPNTIFAEATYIPAYGRVANVMLTPGMSEYEIGIGTNTAPGKKQIALDDLVVCATHDKLILKSKSLGKQVNVTAGHMLNFRNSPHIYRFLRELSFESVRPWQPFEWGKLEQLPFLPRVRYRKTILSPAKWNLFITNCPAKEEIQDDDEWYAWVQNWKSEWRVPRFVYMVDSDNRILLDLEHMEFVKEMRKELLSHKVVTLHERLGSLEDRWVKNHEGHFVAECVFQLEKRDQRKIPDEVSPLIRMAPKEEKTKLPGSEWLFVKLYGGEDRQDEFLSNAIIQFAEKAIQDNDAEKWFFMRYGDPDLHIRLRFNGNPEILMSRLMPKLHQWGQECVNEGLIRKMVIDTYEREVERYGGPRLISAAEHVFHLDSKAACALIHLLRYKQIDWPNYIVAAVSAIDMMKNFNLGYEQQLELLDSTVDKKQYQKEFREWRSDLLEIFSAEDCYEILNTKPGGSVLRHAFEIRASAIQNYMEQMSQEHEKKQIINDVPNIIMSVMHMHFNRLFGINRELEEKAMVFARHALDSVIQYHKHVKR